MTKLLARSLLVTALQNAVEMSAPYSQSPFPARDSQELLDDGGFEDVRVTSSSLNAGISAWKRWALLGNAARVFHASGSCAGRM